MPEIATSKREIILYYNPEINTARQTLGYAIGEGYPVREVNIIKDNHTGTHLEDLADLLGISIVDLVNKDHPGYAEEYGDTDYDDEDWIKILRKQPELIRQPIGVRGSKAMFVNTPSDLARL